MYPFVHESSIGTLTLAPNLSKTESTETTNT